LLDDSKNNFLHIAVFYVVQCLIFYTHPSLTRSSRSSVVKALGFHGANVCSIESRCHRPSYWSLVASGRACRQICFRAPESSKGVRLRQSDHTPAAGWKRMGSYAVPRPAISAIWRSQASKRAFSVGTEHTFPCRPEDSFIHYQLTNQSEFE